MLHKYVRSLGVSVFALAFLLLANLTPLSAQVSGTILGTVTDMSGAAVADAHVEIKNVGTGATATANSDEQGRFRAPELGLGEYEITATKAGFSSVVRKGVTVTVGSQNVVDFSLPVGASQQTITVEGQVSQVETTNAAVANLVEQTQM